MSRTKAVAKWQQKQCQTRETHLRFHWIWGFMMLDVGSEKRRLKMTPAYHLTKMEAIRDGVGSGMNEWGMGRKKRSPVYDILAFKGLKACRVAMCSWPLKCRSGSHKSANPWRQGWRPIKVGWCEATGYNEYVKKEYFAWESQRTKNRIVKHLNNEINEHFENPE